MRFQSVALLLLLTPAAYAQQHNANFDAERKRADELYTAGKHLEALALYEDLCKQDQTIAVFAERHGAGLLLQSAAVKDPKERMVAREQGIAEIRRAQKLGDKSPYVQAVLAENAKSLFGSIMSGVPLSIGYTYGGTAEAQEALRQAEASFNANDLAGAITLYQKAVELDPKWYMASLFTGDAYFRMKDFANAGVWYQKAIDIDPDRDTAYRYLGDALYKSGEPSKAKVMYERAIVAEPYSKTSWLSLQQWINITHTPASRVRVNRPAIHTLNGVLQPDADLATETGDGRSAWIEYEKSRVAHGALTTNQPIVAGGTDATGRLTPSGYRHSIAEESDAIRAMLADVRAKMKAGTVDEAKLDPSIKTLMQIDHDGMLECWVALDAADAGIRSDYANFRASHRDLLEQYIDKYVLHG